MTMRKFIYVLAALILSVAASAQSSDYQRRYIVLRDRVGYSGVGMETLINNWSKAEPENSDMHLASFYFHLSKSTGSEVVVRSEAKYLGTEPVLSLKDTTGTDVHYYEVLTYEDEMFAEALKSLDKAISLSPERIDLRFLKINSYISYERESPDMAMSNIMGLVYDVMSNDAKWVYRAYMGEDVQPVDRELFAEMMKEYCYSLYSLGTPSSYEGFYTLSQRMNKYFPKDPDFIANMASYYLVVTKDYKTALKYYDKALKIRPDDRSTINNAVIASRRMNNAKLEQKYLKMLKK